MAMGKTMYTGKDKQILRTLVIKLKDSENTTKISTEIFILSALTESSKWQVTVFPNSTILKAVLYKKIKESENKVVKRYWKCLKKPDQHTSFQFRNEVNQ